MDTPSKKVKFTPASKGEVHDLAGIGCRIIEDGSNTGDAIDVPITKLVDLTDLNPDNRIACVEFIIPPHTNGPPAHWHEMHDEVFLITAGTIRFHLQNATHIDATVGDHAVVPPRALHTFSNPTDKEARFYDTFTPAFYVNYFKLVEKILREAKEGKVPLDQEKLNKAMAYFATMGVEGAL